MKLMRSIITAICAVFIFTGCQKIGEKIQQKVNEKVDKSVDESIRRADSLINNIGKELDTLSNKSFDKMDSVKYKLDSANKEIKEMIEKQKKLIEQK